jgi:hypothetical protein
MGRLVISLCPLCLCGEYFALSDEARPQPSSQVQLSFGIGGQEEEWEVGEKEEVAHIGMKANAMTLVGHGAAHIESALQPYWMRLATIA